MSRADPHLHAPRDVTGFPREAIAAGTVTYRAHEARDDDGTERSPWWFATAQADPNDGGRFDLPAPMGTCYVAFDPETALRERFGEAIMAIGAVTDVAVDKTAVSILQFPEDVDAAHPTHPRAANWINRELSAGLDYEVTQQWARALADDGAGGIVYQSRFTTVSDANALAAFGEGGVRDWPVEGTEDVRALLAGAGVHVTPSKKPRAAFKKAEARSR